MAITKPSHLVKPWKGSVDAAKNWQRSLNGIMIDIWKNMLPRAHEYNLQRALDKQDNEGIAQRRKALLDILHNVVGQLIFQLEDRKESKWTVVSEKLPLVLNMPHHQQQESIIKASKIYRPKERADPTVPRKHKPVPPGTPGRQPSGKPKEVPILRNHVLKETKPRSHNPMKDLTLAELKLALELVTNLIE